MQRLNPYSPQIEEQMCNLYHSLSEKDRRRYAGVEAKKLGYGGVSYVCRLFQCDKDSVKRGIQELEQPLAKEPRIRQPGAGRKRRLETEDGLETAFEAVMTRHIAGSPMDETVKWSNLSRVAIAEKMQEHGYKVSVTIVDQLLEKHNYRRRKAFKSVAGKQVAQRNEQFEKIGQLIDDAQQVGNPVMSMDVKKKS
jgi:hypothetical protein